MLAREAVQNSWDAHIEGTVAEFGMHCWEATHTQLSVLRNEVFRQVPPHSPLGEYLKRDTALFLAVSDRGTVGLGGPTRADIAPGPGVRTDFVDFLRNIGQPPDHEFGGGTYGFGKAAFYAASHTRSICVYTRCTASDHFETRLLAAAFGRPYAAHDGTRHRRYTGRHWWGRVVDNVVEPARDSEADAIAESLGLQLFEAEERGTTILVPFPDLEDRTPDALIAALRQGILRYFWPKMIDGPEGTGTMRFRLSLNGVEHPIPHPSTVPEFTGFVAAYQNIARSRVDGPALIGAALTKIDCGRPSKHLGMLSLVRYAPLEREAPNGSPSDTSDPLMGSVCHHVALMRAPHFVVRYLSGPSVPFDQVEYAGVFLADRGADASFAKSEPPTHDDWVAESLSEPNDRTFVRIALKRINEKVDVFMAPPDTKLSPGPDIPLADFADQLASLIPMDEGPGAGLGGGGNGGGGGGGGGGGSAGRPKIQVDRLTRIELVEGLAAAVVDFEITHQGTKRVVVRANAAVLLDGGAVESDAPIGADRPRVLRWSAPDGGTVEGVEEVEIPADKAGRWSVAVSIPSDAMIGVSIEISDKD